VFFSVKAASPKLKMPPPLRSALLSVTLPLRMLRS